MAKTIDDQFKKPKGPKLQGTGFTNLQQIQTANKGASQRLGQTVTSGVSGVAQGARQGLQQAGQQFTSKVEANRLGTDADRSGREAVINQALQPTVDKQPAQPGDGSNQQLEPQGGLVQEPQANPYAQVNYKPLDQQQVDIFQRYRTGQYGGPTDLENRSQIMQQAQEGEDLSRLASSSGGREALLQRFVGGNKYTSGQKRLDNLLLGQSNDALRQSAAAGRGLADESQRQIQALRGLAQGAQDQARLFTDETGKLLGEKTGGIETDIATRQKAAETEELDRAADLDAARQLIGQASTNPDALLRQSGIDPKTIKSTAQRQLTASGLAIDKLAAEGRLNGAEAEQVKLAIKKEAARTGGKPAEVLSKFLQNKAAEGVFDPNNFRTSEQAAQLNALKQLQLQEGGLQAGKGFTAGEGGVQSGLYDVDQRIQKEQAGLNTLYGARSKGFDPTDTSFLGKKHGMAGTGGAQIWADGWDDINRAVKNPDQLKNFLTPDQAKKFDASLDRFQAYEKDMMKKIKDAKPRQGDMSNKQRILTDEYRNKQYDFYQKYFNMGRKNVDSGAGKDTQRFTQLNKILGYK